MRPMSERLCRHCTAPLPPVGPGGAGACSACGTLFGLQADLEEYAKAVLDGRSDVPRPSALPQKRMRVEWQRSADENYRERRAGRLNIVISHLAARSLALWPLTLLAAGGVAYGWWYLRGTFSWILALATLFVAARVVRRTLTLFDRFELSLDESTLRTSTSRFWPRRVVELPRANVAQLFAIKPARGYGLAAATKDGKTRIIAFPIATAELAWYLERQVELAAGIGDKAVAKELNRSMPAPKTSTRLLTFVEVGFLLLLTGGAVFGVRSCGAPLGSVAVQEVPRELSVELPKAGVLFFSTELDFAQSRYYGLDEVPRSMRYDIQVLQGAKALHSMSCDPVDMFIWVSSTTNKKYSSVEGRMNGCAVKLPAGTYTVRVARTWLPGPRRVRYSQTEITARLD